MSRQRVLGGNDFICSSGHAFHAMRLLDYSNQIVQFEVTVIAGNWVAPLDRPPKSVLPVCPTCDEALSYDGNFEILDRRRSSNAQVSDAEAAVVAIHPVTGEVSYFADRTDRAMPERLTNAGYVPVRFKKWDHLQKFCRSQNLVNDIETDHPDGLDADYREQQRRFRDRQNEAAREMRDAVEELRRRGGRPEAGSRGIGRRR